MRIRLLPPFAIAWFGLLLVCGLPAQAQFNPPPNFPEDTQDLKDLLEKFRQLQKEVKDQPQGAHLPAFRQLDAELASAERLERMRRQPMKGSREAVLAEIKQARRDVRLLVVGSPDPFSLENRRGLSPDEELLQEQGLKIDGEALMRFFRERTLSPQERTEYLQLIPKLGSESYRARDKAMEQLARRGPAIVEILRSAALQGDLELARRVERCLFVLQERERPRNVLSASLRVLNQRAPDALIETLFAYLPYANYEELAEDIREILTTHAVRKKTPHPVLAQGLTSDLPLLRAAAGEALARAGYLDPAIRALLKDKNPLVRYRVGIALTLAGEKEAVSVLADSLPEMTLAQAWHAEDLLFRLAHGKNPPSVAVSNEPQSREKSRNAWTAWLKTNHDKLDFALLKNDPPLKGHTLIVLLDMGRVVELGKRDEVLWSIDGLVFPLDVQMVGERSVLVAEYHGGRVTERDLTGKILWEKEIQGALVAQRLNNGNTFIATDSQLLEVDKAGNEVLRLGSPQEGERIMKASKLPNGDMAVLTSAARIYRVDTTGQIRSQFDVSLGARLSGGRIHMLPDGKVLVPHNAENKVVEYDPTGKILWEAAVDAPVAVTRLPNGNTLVTSMFPQRGAVELDRNGKEVWTYRTETRVTRAYRR